MLQCALEAQTAPQTQKAPSSKTYKPSSSNLPHVASCPKFSESPEEGVYYNVADVNTPPTPLLFVAVGLTKAGQQAYKNNLLKIPMMLSAGSLWQSTQKGFRITRVWPVALALILTIKPRMQRCNIGLIRLVKRERLLRCGSL